MKKESLKTLANRVQDKADDLHFIRVRGNRALVRIASATGGTERLVSRSWLENYETELDALS